MDNNTIFLNLLPDIWLTDTPDDFSGNNTLRDYSSDSGLGSLHDIPDELSVSLSSIYGNTNATNEELFDEIKLLKDELNGLKIAKTQSDSFIAQTRDNYLELEASFKILHEKNQKLESQNRNLILRNEEYGRDLATSIYEKQEINRMVEHLSQKWKGIEIQNGKNCQELNLMRDKNLRLAHQLSTFKVQEPEVIVKYVQVEEKTKWMRDFEDIREDLTDEEENYVMNTIPSKKTRQFLVKNVNRRRNGDFMSFAEKNAKTQKFIEHMKREHLEEIENMTVQYNVLREDYNNEVDEREYDLQCLEDKIQGLEDERQGLEDKIQGLKDELKREIKSSDTKIANLINLLGEEEKKNLKHIELLRDELNQLDIKLKQAESKKIVPKENVSTIDVPTYEKPTYYGSTIYEPADEMLTDDVSTDGASTKMESTDYGPVLKKYKDYRQKMGNINEQHKQFAKPVRKNRNRNRNQIIYKKTPYKGNKTVYEDTIDNGPVKKSIDLF